MFSQWNTIKVYKKNKKDLIEIMECLQYILLSREGGQRYRPVF